MLSESNAVWRGQEHCGKNESKETYRVLRNSAVLGQGVWMPIGKPWSGLKGPGRQFAAFLCYRQTAVYLLQGQMSQMVTPWQWGGIIFFRCTSHAHGHAQSWLVRFRSEEALRRTPEQHLRASVWRHTGLPGSQGPELHTFPWWATWTWVSHLCFSDSSLSLTEIRLFLWYSGIFILTKFHRPYSFLNHSSLCGHRLCKWQITKQTPTVICHNRPAESPGPALTDAHAK